MTKKALKIDEQAEEDDGSFTWGYRKVNTKSENNGRNWYCLQEVTYKNGKPTGFGDPCTGSESMKSMSKVWEMMGRAMNLPPLQEKDFKGESK